MVLTILAATILATPRAMPYRQHEHLAGPTAQNTADGWLKVLNAALGGDNVACLVDLPDDREPIELSSGRSIGRSVLDGFSLLFDRDLLVIDHSVILARTVLTRSPSQEKDGERLLEILESLSAGELGRLSTRGADLNSLPRELRSVVAKISNSNPGLAQRIVAGDFTQVKLYASPIVKYTDPKTGKRVTTTLAEFPVTSQEEQDGRKELEASHQAADRTRLHDGTGKTDGIDLGQGRIVTYGELVTECREKHGVAAAFDKRLSSSSLYVRGVFTKSELLQGLQRLLAAQQPSVEETGGQSQSSRVTALLAALSESLEADRFVGIGSVSGEDLRSGRKFSATELASMSTRFGNLARQLGLPDGSMVEVGLGVGISIYADGYSATPYGSATVDGRPATLMTPNNVQFRINP